jgi:hypothetical protein
MALALVKSVTAMGPGLTTYVLGVGGTEPYVYSVEPGGAGGTINSGTGLYTAPSSVNSNPALTSDTIKVTDDDGAEATGTILITSPLGLFAEIIQKEMGLNSSHIYFWDQKLFQPKDSGLYVAISIERAKPFANVNKYDPTTNKSEQYLNVMATLGVDIISRSFEAVARKEEVVLALNSNYSRTQQVANSFQIGQLPANSDFLNLSVIDGAAIPYRFRISVNILYTFRKNQPVPYFDQFEDPETVVNA